MEDGLLAFAFDGQPQDIDRFRNEPFWRERFGDIDGERRFRWTEFYGAVAAKLLDYRADRRPLIEGIHAIAKDTAGLSYLQDRYPEGGTGPLRDICPFTAMGTFNRSMTDANRRLIAGAPAKLIGVEEEPHASFEGIPVLNNQRSWFFRYPVHSFPELSLASWHQKAPEDVQPAPDKAAPTVTGDEDEAAVEPVAT